MTGAELIAAERQRQIEQEGWTPEHDEQHGPDFLATAGVCYALPRNVRDRTIGLTGVTLRDYLWPWAEEWWKPCPRNRIRELAKAGALIAAEIDRLQRAEERGEA